MGKNRRRPTLTMACLSLLMLLGVMLRVAPALAETLSVSGNDCVLSTQNKEDGVNILTVSGQKGETVYINMKKGDQLIASHLAFTLDDKNAEADANNDMVGVVSVEFAAGAFSYDDTYTVDVYADRAQKTKLYDGTVSTSFALFEDDNAIEPLVVRTIGGSDANRKFSVPTTLTHKGVNYELKSSDAQNKDGKTCYVYASTQNVEQSTEGHVSYYDIDNADKPIKLDTVALNKGESKTVEIPSVVASDEDGLLYRTLQLTDSATLSYPGVTEYSVTCKKLTSWTPGQSFYKATIQYVDDKGNSLGVNDSVIVNKDYTYTAPDKLYVDSDGVVKQYQIQSKDKAVLRLKPGDADEATTYKIAYTPVPDDAERTWTVVLENGSVSPKDPNRVIKRVDLKGKPGETKTYATEQKIKVGGVDYVPTAAARESYEHTFSAGTMDTEQTIYYVPDGYVAPEPYDVTVKYVNVATNEVIDTQAYTASPDMRADLEIESPETFSAGGVEWVRLNGQEKAIRHSYYSAAREYAVYYRDVNDDLHATTVIRTVRVVYVDEEGNTVTRPTTVVDNGTVDNGVTDNGVTDNGVADAGTTDEGTTDAGTTDAGTTGAGTAGAATGADAAAPTDTGLQTGADLRSVDGADGSSVVAEDGTDLATTRIEDDQTPLAQSASDKASDRVDPRAIAIGGGAAAAVAAGVALFLVFRRRRKNADESSDEDATA